jgi:protein-S-isoprenylcysteine O-methyltransferase Ste14
MPQHTPSVSLRRPTMLDLAGFFAPFLIYAVLLLLHLLLPARQVDGYVRDPETGEPLRYRLNGLAVLFVATFGWVLVGWLGWLPFDWLYHHRWASLAGACTIGLLFTLWIVLPAPRTGKPLLADLYLGRRENPQFLGGRVDAKMFLYLVGAVMLELNALSFAAHHYMAFPDDPSPGVALHLALLSWFICDYLVFERVHLYTYDLFAERVGFKLGWGCLTFYPYFYAIGLWAIVDRPNPHVSPLLTVGAALVFFTGWMLARGANMQKYTFKTEPERVFLGVIPPEVVSDGSRALLCSGFWGVSRHVNYLGEILMASGLALALGYASCPWPWLYPLYYVVLLFPRERDDDRRCAAKYGELWTQYCDRVRYRIIPGVY